MKAASCSAQGRALVVGLGLLLTFLVGCGGGQGGTLSGKVTYKGANLKGGDVTIIGADGKAGGTFPIGLDGSYTARNLPVGEAKIGVDTSSLKPRKMPKGAEKASKPPPGAKLPEGGYNPTTGGDPERYVEIPGKYKSPEKSGLKVTIAGGSQSHDIKLD